MAQSTDSQERLEAFNEKLRRLGIFGYWMRSGREQRQTEPSVLKWSTIYPLLLEAGEVVRLGGEAFRRNMGGYQIVMPGEHAAAHRHTASAMRFIVVGDGSAYTTTNGEQMFMEPGDLLVQPSFGWHDHSNPGEEPVIWMDMLDTSLIQTLEVEFREEWPGADQQPVTHPEGFHAQLYGMVRPARLIGSQLGSPQDSPPVTYKFRDARKTLELMAAEEEFDPYDGVLLEYANPATGGHTLPTMCARLQMLRPGEATRPHRHTGGVRYHVVQGQGASILDLESSKELAWEDHDSFHISSWHWHQHRNRSKTEPAILFSISDSPIAEAFGFYREEKG
ncbi:MAG: cupin domain-containing protein [Chloroflexi bacterium]|nr:cupin domain-containing protein [Chloroflexota bacterium]